MIHRYAETAEDGQVSVVCKKSTHERVRARHKVQEGS